MNPTEAPDFQYKTFLAAAEGLRVELQRGLAASADEAVRALDAELPQPISDSSSPALTIAFVGQYNAGKSTLIKALTLHEEIAIDADVCTNVVTAYDWHGVRLLDTPGIRAGLVEHDRLAEDQIIRSDLLVFMITAELFGDTMGAYFRELAFTNRRASEMMLVVNKMDQDCGTPEVKRGDIELVTSPLRMEDFRTVFVSAELFLEAQKENDAEMRALLVERSGIGKMINALNAFAQENGFLGALTTPLFSVRAVAVEAAALCTNHRPEERAALELLRRRMKMLRESRSRLHSQVHGLLNRGLTDLASTGDQAAGAIEPSRSEDDIKQVMSRAEREASARVEQLRDEVSGAIKCEQKLLADELKRLNDSTLAARLRSITGSSEAGVKGSTSGKQGAWQGVKPSGEGVERESASRIQKLSDVVGNIGSLMVQFTKGTRAVSGWGPAAAAGSQAHKLIYGVGKFFGASFKPWQAARIASNFGKIGRVLGPLGAVLQVFGQITEERMEESERIKLNNARSDTRALYWDSASDVRTQFASEFEQFMEDFYQPLVSETEAMILAMEDASSHRGEEAIQFQKIATSALALIEQIQES